MTYRYATSELNRRDRRPETLTAETALQLLKGKQERTIEHATTIRLLDNGDIAIRYHATDVVTLHPDGAYTLRSGGWYSPTTKTRINAYAPVHLAASGGLWFLRGALSPANEPWSYPTLFMEGMQVDRDGNPAAPVDPAPVLAAKRKLDRQVATYIKGYIAAALAAGRVESPSGGDCWPCCMRPDDGSEGMGLDHYLSHFEETYYVPSLLVNALRERYREEEQVGYAWHRIQADLARGREPWAMRNALTRFLGRRKPALLGLAQAVPAPTKGWQG